MRWIADVAGEMVVVGVVRYVAPFQKPGGCAVLRDGLECVGRFREGWVVRGGVCVGGCGL